MSLTEEKKFSNRSKHIDIRYHFLKDLVRDAQVKLEYVPTHENVADLMTKPLGASKIKKFRSQAGLMCEITRVEEECCMYATHAMKITTRRHRPV